jgi:hypothetical protein
MDTERSTAARERAHVILERVKHLLARMQPTDVADQSRQACEWKHPYTAKPCLSAHQLAAWEAANGASLPEAYRLFLLEVGNGGTMPGPYCDFEVWPFDPSKIDHNFQKAFPITKGRLDTRMAQLRAEGRPRETILFPELAAYLKEGMPPGCLGIGQYPSYDRVFLVITGELSGMVWCAVSGGVPEFDAAEKLFDFLSWFEDTLLDVGRW